MRICHIPKNQGFLSVFAFGNVQIALLCIGACIKLYEKQGYIIMADNIDAIHARESKWQKKWQKITKQCKLRR